MGRDLHPVFTRRQKRRIHSGFFVSVIQRGVCRVILLWRAVLGTLVVAAPSIGSANPFQPVAQRFAPLSTVTNLLGVTV